MTQQMPRASLGVISFGLAVGVTWAVGVFLLGLMAGLFGWGVPLVAVLSSIYIGYAPSFVGSIAGAVWGFVDGLICGVLIAWLYNRFLVKRALPAPTPVEESTAARAPTTEVRADEGQGPVGG